MTRLLIATTVPLTLRSFLLPFADHFRALGWQVDAIAADGPDCDVSRGHFDRVWPASWSRSPLSLQNLAAARELQALVAREQYDLVHVHTPVAGFVTRWALRTLRRAGGPKIVYTAHGFHFHDQGSALNNAMYQALEQMAAPWTDRLVVINHADERAARAWLPAEKLCYMPGIGIDLGRYQQPSEPARQAIRAQLGVAEAQPLLSAVAELIPRKRHADLFHAFARLARPDAVLALAGDGPEEEALHTLAETLGIAPQLRFLGWHADVAGLLASSDVALLVSEQEGLPRSVMEAMAVGVPVIGTDIRGTRDLLEDGHGLVVPVGDVGAIAQAIAQLLDQPGEAARLAERARQRIASYELQHVLALHEALYADVLAR